MRRPTNLQSSIILLRQLATSVCSIYSLTYTNSPLTHARCSKLISFAHYCSIQPQRRSRVLSPLSTCPFVGIISIVHFVDHLCSVSGHLSVHLRVRVPAAIRWEAKVAHQERPRPTSLPPAETRFCNLASFLSLSLCPPAIPAMPPCPILPLPIPPR